MKLISFIVVTVFLAQCASVNVEKNMPFTIKNATYSTNENELIVAYSSDKHVDFQEIFYNNRKVKAVVVQQGEKNFVKGTFTKVLLQDFNLHSDPKKEFGNKPTTTSEEKIPFELNENEAIISYKVYDELKYHRITSVVVK